MSAPQTNLFSKQPLCLKYIPQNELLLPPRHCLQIKGIKQLIFGLFFKKSCYVILRARLQLFQACRPEFYSSHVFET